MFYWSGIRNKHNGLVPFVSQWIKQKKLLKKSQSTRQLAYTRVTVSSKRRIKLIKHRRSSLIKQWNNALLWQTTYYTKFPNLKNLEIKKHVSPYPTTFIQRSNKYTSNLSFFQRKKRTVIVQLQVSAVSVSSMNIINIFLNIKLHLK